MTPQPITSRHNPAFKALRAICHDARTRRQEALTVLDGVHLIEACLAAGVVPRALWLAEGAVDDPQIAQLVAALSAPTQRCPQFSLPAGLFKEAAPTETPSGVMAVIDIPAPARPLLQGTVLVLDGVQDAGNVGAMLRTAAAAAVDQVWLTPGCAQAWSPKVLRAGMGAHFCVSMAEGVAALDMLGAARQPVIATDLAATDSLFETDLRGPVVWLFGAEGRGLNPSLLSRATQRLRIPMPGKVESLNVAAAAAVCLFEQLRQRG